MFVCLLLFFYYFIFFFKGLLFNTVLFINVFIYIFTILQNYNVYTVTVSYSEEEYSSFIN